MIVELFGPAGAGKTTLAQALAEALGRRGEFVQVASSARPAEGGSTSAIHAMSARAAKVLELPALMRGSSKGRAGAIARWQTLRPSASVLWRLRFSCYLTRLESAWRDAASGTAITIFDQGYISALAAVVLRSPAYQYDELASCLRELPTADVTIHVSAPHDVIEQRLAARLASQHWIERMFELDPSVARHQPEIFEKIASLLTEQQRTITRVISASAEDLSRSELEIVRFVGDAASTKRSGVCDEFS